MAWITPTDVAGVYTSDDASVADIQHVQGLAEIEIGTQTEPVGAGLKAVTVEIVHRFLSAKDSPANVRTEQLGPHSTTYASTSGFGLTDREIAKLKKAAGTYRPLWVQPTYRDSDEEVLWPTITPTGAPGEPIHTGPL